MAQPRSLAFRNPASELMGLQTVPSVAILQPENDIQRSTWRSQIQNLYRTPQHEQVKATDQVLSSIQAVLVGSALGLVDAYNDGLDVKGVPVDLTAASVLSIAAVLYDSRATARAADSCNTIYGFRKVKSVLGMLGSKMMGGAKQVVETSSVAGEVSERAPVPPGKDPIVAIGESL